MTFCASELKWVDVFIYFQSEPNFITLHSVVISLGWEWEFVLQMKGTGETHCRIGCKYVWILSFNDLD
jgi:hypothetical protein